MRERNAQRRALGLCVNCPMPSPRFWRCACCRLLWAEKQRKYSRRYHQRHREAHNQRMRDAYHASKTLAGNGASLTTSGVREVLAINPSSAV
jgi:hypothetical protein